MGLEQLCCGDEGMDGEGLLGVKDTADGSYLVQVLGTNAVLLWRRLDGGGTKPTVGVGKVVMTGEKFGEGGR